MTLIRTKFGFHSTADEVAGDIDLTGKRVIITGASSGIGIETARSLARSGADVTLAVRNAEAGKIAAQDVISTTGNENIHVAQLDLEDLGSINTFVSSWDGKLDILINNAGVMAGPDFQKTDAGIELQFATNHLGPFALTIGLYPALRSAHSARVINVSSSANLFSPIVFDDINYNFRPYDPYTSYGQSKTAGILFSVGITEQWRKDGITSNALNPGAILTNLQRNVGGKLASAPELHKNAQQGASTTVLLATSPLLDGIGGKYFENCNEAATVKERPKNYEGVAAYALDKENAERLWQVSLGLISNHR